MGNAAFTPSFTDYKDLKPFRFWCQKVLPTVYDDSLSYYELLGKVVEYLNDMIDDVEAVEANTDAILDAFNQLQEYVNEYLGGAEFEAQLDAAIDAKFASEEFTTELTTLISTAVGAQIGDEVGSRIGNVVANQIGAVVASQIDDVVAGQIDDAVVDPVEEWLAENVASGDIVLDQSMSIYGAAADAGEVGQALLKSVQSTDELFEEGSIVYNTGANNDNSTALTYNRRSKTAFDVNFAIGMSVDSDYRASVYAYSGNTYVGYYNTSEQAFVQTSPSHVTDMLVTSFNFAKYAQYTFKIVLERADGTTQLSDAGTSVLFRVVRKVDNTLSIDGDMADAKVVGSAFDLDYVPQTLSAIADGYINTSGQVAGTGANARHLSFDVTTEYVGKHFKVTGSLWWSLLPYVFVGSDNTTQYPALTGSGTVQTIQDLNFTPNKTGTLYINYHTDAHTYGLTMYELISLKGSELPADIGDYITDINSYNTVSFTTQSEKYVNASTGAITNATGANAYKAIITNYIPVIGNTPYLITTEHFWSNGMYVFYDANYNYISGYAAQSGGTITKIKLKKVIAPSNAAYMIVGLWMNSNDAYMYIAEGISKLIMPSEKWSGIKWACVGDSLTENNDKAARHYYDYISEATGITPLIYGVGGTGYARGQGEGNAFYQRVSSIDTSVNVITIFGSFNDLGAGLPIGNVTDSGTTTIAGCMNTTIDNILAIIPTANIGIVAPCPWGTTQPSASGTVYDYVEMLKAIAEHRSIPFLDLWRGSGLMPWNAAFAAIAYPTGDVVHPNEIGHKILAPKFKNFLEQLLM